MDIVSWVYIKCGPLSIRTTKCGYGQLGLLKFRTRYQGIKQIKSRSNFEEDILKANLNGEDIGHIHHSWVFAKKLDKAIYKTMKCDIQDNMNCMLDAIQSNKTAGLVMDKITSNKLTGHIYAIIIPITENPQTKNLAESAKEALNNA